MADAVPKPSTGRFAALEMPLAPAGSGHPERRASAFVVASASAMPEFHFFDNATGSLARGAAVTMRLH